jgi:hypothetical protein
VRTLIGWAVALTAVVGLAIAVIPAAAGSESPRPGHYRITITDLTNGQPFTPPVVAIERRPVELFDLGQKASTEIGEIAENGDLSGMQFKFLHDERVVAFTTAPAPLVPVGREAPTGFSDHFTTALAGSDARFLSFASMLICTNDGFSGVNSLRLPDDIGATVTVHLAALDAGTEANTERFADIVPPCKPLILGSSSGSTNNHVPEFGVVTHHPGIKGVGDLSPAVFGWTDPVLRVEVTALP